jgi:hypothetical protein
MTIGTWIETFSGHKLDVFNINQEAIDIVDIAHALSMACRFNGHLKKFLSVAEHSIIVASMVEESHQLAALLHDSAEAYITDVPRPIKQMLPAINDLDAALTKAVFEKYGCEYPIHEEIRAVDRELCLAEARDSNMDVDSWTETYAYLEHTPFHWSPVEAEKYFLKMFHEMTGGVYA